MSDPLTPERRAELNVALLTELLPQLDLCISPCDDGSCEGAVTSGSRTFRIWMNHEYWIDLSPLEFSALVDAERDYKEAS